MVTVYVLVVPVYDFRKESELVVCGFLFYGSNRMEFITTH